MSRSYRSIVFALVGWLSLANAQGPSTNTEQPKAEANQLQPVKPIAPPTTEAVEPVESPELYRPCDQGQDARNSDLCAQWKAADAARDAANWTYWGVLLGIVGTVGLFWTLYYTRKAVLAAESATKDADSALAIASRNADAAAKMAKIAAETNEIARQSQLAELRPYIYVKESRIENGMVFVHLHNFGRTPAIGLRVKANWAVVDNPYSGPFPGALIDSDHSLELAPSQHLELDFALAGITDEMSVAIQGDERMLIVQLSYSYQDLLGRGFSNQVRQGAKGHGYTRGTFHALNCD